MLITRRNTLRLGAAAAGSLALPRLSFAQGNRPAITIAVQKIVNSNTLDVLREQSNVGERVFFGSIWESLIGRNLRGQLEAQPMLATEWKRIDDQTVELKLREGVRFHNGDEMTAEDVVFTFSRERMFGETEPKNRSTIKAFEAIPTPRPGKELPPEVPAVARRAWPDLARVDIVDKYTVRFVNATPDVTLEGRLLRYGSDIMSRRGWEEAASYLDWARKPVTTGPYKVERFTPDTELLLVSHDDYWGGLPPLQSIRFVEVPEVASRVNGLLSGEYDFACDLPPDQLDEILSLLIDHGVIGLLAIVRGDDRFALICDPANISAEVVAKALWYDPSLTSEWAARLPQSTAKLTEFQEEFIRRPRLSQWLELAPC